MFSLLNTEKKAKKPDNQISKVREIFNSGRFPVVTTESIEGRQLAKVLGLVCCRGFDADEAFYGMLSMAMKKGAQAIIAYTENVAFHPDGSKFFSCYGTAVMFERESRDDLIMLPMSAMNSMNSMNINSMDSYSKPVLDEVFESKDTAYSYNSKLYAEEKTKMFSSRVDEEDDPVLQRLLAGQAGA